MQEQKVGVKKNGGARPGAGRKKGTSGIIMERSRTFVLQRIERELGMVLDSSFQLAKGITILTDEGIVYKKAPDTQILKHLIDQLVGKPKESVAVEHSGAIGLADLLGKSALDNHETEKK